MSTDIESKMEFHTLTQYWGGNEKGVCLQVNHPTLLKRKPAMKMKLIPSGLFTMGSDEFTPPPYPYQNRQAMPTRQVFIKEFYLAETPVTQKEFLTIFPNFRFFNKGPLLPAEGISWYDAMDYIAELNKRTTKNFRLPSEAEWEYACRAGTTTRYNTGDTITHEQANFYPSPKYHLIPAPVQSFPPNQWGLYEMHGNINELCADDWVPNHINAPLDATPRVSDNIDAHVVIKGGSDLSSVIDLSSSNRYGIPKQSRRSDIGFRLAHNT